MLFNSYLFIFLFLPITLALYFLLGKYRLWNTAKFWLIFASLTFYGYWNPKYILLLILSITFNYSFGRILAAQRSRTILTIAIAANLLVLAYYKYFNFFISNLDHLLGWQMQIQNIILPLGISFITFQKIAYLVDCYKGIAVEKNFLDFSLFVVFFPQLIAGPIVHHAEVLPQFKNKAIFNFNYTNINIGLIIFIIGLTKKVLVADHLGLVVNSSFSAFAAGENLGTFMTWISLLSYAFQLYFDFSGYGDMAVGLAKMMGVELPINFYSPYKAPSLIEFWRRWNMTLTRFLRDYLYLPLAASRQDAKKWHYANLFITMTLGGFWHGANWTFIIWGIYHGFCLTINHLWREWCLNKNYHNIEKSTSLRFLSVMLTFIVVMLGWILFRSPDLHTAALIFKNMFWINTILPMPLSSDTMQLEIVRVILAAMIIWLVPNTYELVGYITASTKSINQYLPTGNAEQALVFDSRWAFLLAGLSTLCIMNLMQGSPFLYFQF
jgi:alginate O-acetyltransferase complex protein AlgI